MAHSVEGITVDMLQYVSQMFLTETTLKAANAILVDYHHRLALSSIYGTGIASSSDGQRFGIQASWGRLTKRNFKYAKELCLLVGGSARARHEERSIWGPTIIRTKTTLSSDRPNLSAFGTQGVQR
jgi:hypothetical protein